MFRSSQSFGCLAAISLLFLIQGGDEVLGQDRRDSSIGAGDDCTDISIHFRDAENLTRQERIALMDKAFFGSLSKYERCALRQLETKSSRNSSGGALGHSGGDGSNEGSLDSASANANNQEANDSSKGKREVPSVASTNLTGTEKTVDTNEANAERSEKFIDSAKADLEGEPQNPQNKDLLNNGKVPDDIPSVDNDSVLEAQIRHAAMNEPDPTIRKKLWDEYRKYKGLPITKQGSKEENK